MKKDYFVIFFNILLVVSNFFYKLVWPNCIIQCAVTYTYTTHANR